MSNPTKLPPGSSWLGEGPANCSAQCGAKKVLRRQIECFKSISLKETREECAEGRVSFCRLPQPHTTCRLTQVDPLFLGFLSQISDIFSPQTKAFIISKPSRGGMCEDFPIFALGSVLRNTYISQYTPWEQGMYWKI